MGAVRPLTRAAVVVLLGAAAAVWYACTDHPADSATGPAPVPSLSARRLDFRTAMAVQQRHTDDLLAIPGVVGTAVAVLPDGRIGMQVLLERAGIRGLPQVLDGVPVAEKVTGRFMAFSDPTKRQRPAPLGFSVGHPLITAGTIGARVKDALGRVYILSNNHVLANSNGATLGDPEYQPGPFDGGTAADQIATLSDFQMITFTSTANNTIDAAIALSNTVDLDNATPADEGYGLPNSAMYGDADGDGLFDDPSALLGLNVQKYGRTTHLTHGQITGVNATVMICYQVSGFSCTKAARFVDQLVISPSGFSGGGDSGSLIVTDDGDLNPVALLFAGSSTTTIGNRIDLVLNRFGVTIDGFDPLPPGPFTDVAVTGVSAPAAAVADLPATVTVTVKNRGNQDVTSSFDVALQDGTESVSVGTQSVAGLAVGASATLSFVWTPHALGDHRLVGSHTLSDDRAVNNQDSTSVTVNPPTTDVGVISVTAPAAVSVGHTINVAVKVQNVGNQNVDSSFVVALRDTTDGVTLGSQSVPGLAVGASATVTFSWNTTNATLGSHVLVASHSLSDDNAANNQRAAGVSITPKVIDVALTNITGPASVAQGDTAHFAVSVQNVGEQDITANFNVVLTDGNTGTPIDTESVAGLALGAVATLDFPWNTAGVATGGHTLFAQQLLADDNSTNNSKAIGINVTAPVNPPGTDIAVTGVNAPSAVAQGTTATIGVTVQNVGGQDITGSFDVVLTDSTTGATIGTQTVSGLAVGAIATRSFNWNTTGAALGNHTLVATANFADATPANNRRSATVQVNTQPIDLAVTSLTAPSSVTQGDTAHIGVTVQNVGGQNVTTSFNVVLTDGNTGTAIATQTIPGLAVGAVATLDFPWNTAGVTISGHTLIAQQMLADANAGNNALAKGITVKAPVTPPATDLAVTAMTAPSALTQGSSASIGVTVQNVGGQDVTTSFDVVLSDSTAGVTIGTQTITGLPVSASTTRTFTWNTTGAALGGHTLVATQTLADANAANNRRSAMVTVNAQQLDIALTGLTAPTVVTQGNTAALGVTVQNVGGQSVSTGFDVVLTDSTTGAVLGTQTLAGLAAGASATLPFNWNTTGAAVGSHTLVATHTLTDDNAANNRRAAAITVNSPPVDLALTAVTGPAAVTQGDTAHIGVTVQNVGGADVSTAFTVVLTDATAGVTIGTQPLAGLAAGAVATLDFTWNTAGAATTGHTLIAQQTLADNNSTNNSKAIGVTVNAPSVHVGNLTGTATRSSNTWSATVEITVHDQAHILRNDVLVRGSWGNTTGECLTGTGGNGTCTIVLASIPNSTGLVSFAISSLTATGYLYKPAANHDPDGSSNGTTIFVRR